jgi:hypothetical protein
MPADPNQEQPAAPVGEGVGMGYVDAPAQISRRGERREGVQSAAACPVDVADVTSHQLTTSPALAVRLSDAQATQRRAALDGESR